MDPLLLQERIVKTVELGESQFREFKSAYEGPPDKKNVRPIKSIAKDIAEALVAFANADGGELLIGVEDDGSITGISYDDNGVSILLEVPKTGVHKETPLSSPIAKKVEINGKNILYFAVEKSTRTIHQTSDGRCLQRKDRDTCPVSAVSLQFERQEQLSREYDRQFVDNADVPDLDIDLLNRISSETSMMSPEKCLQYYGLAEYGMNRLRLRRAALLLFAKDIMRWHPRCQVRVVRIKGTELKTGRDYNVLLDELATANILRLVTLAWEKLRPHLVETKMTSEALFKEKVMYPEDACREALINAITHRDYSYEGQNIEILIFDDRMEVHSPGSLLSTIHIEDLKKLKGTHESRNALVARVLREIGYVREMGEGMRRIFSLMKDADLVPPELNSTAGQFSIILKYKSVFSEADQAWLSNFKPLKLTREEMLVALLGKSSRLISPIEIYTLLNLVDWDLYRAIIEQMYAKGILYNAVTKAAKDKIWRQKGISKREIPRLVIRRPEEIEKSLEELFSVIQKKGKAKVVDKLYITEVFNQLPSSNIYRESVFQTTLLLKLLGFIDDTNKPTSLLEGLWAHERSIKSTLEPTSTIAEPRIIKAPSDGKTGAPIDIFVGNLEYDTTEFELFNFFQKCGQVLNVNIPKDYSTGRSRGFGFVKMANRIDAKKAIEELNGKLFRGRILHLNWGR